MAPTESCITMSTERDSDTENTVDNEVEEAVPAGTISLEVPGW